MSQKNKGRPRRQRDQSPDRRKRADVPDRAPARFDRRDQPQKPRSAPAGQPRGERREVFGKGGRAERDGQREGGKGRSFKPSDAFAPDRPAPRGRVRFDKRKPPHERSRNEDRQHDRKPEREDDRRAHSERLWIYGRHAVAAAIFNPNRKIKRVLAHESAMDWLAGLKIPKDRDAYLVRSTQDMLDRALHSGAVHQGVAAEVEDLPRARLKDACQPEALRPVVVLDQITDPHNIGAIFRSAAAFNARAIIVQERRTPPLAGALAKAAAGAVEMVPAVAVVNIARALEGLKTLGYYCAGLAGEAGEPIGSLPKDRPVALVLGAEGAGLRKLVRDSCDGLYSIPMARGVDSLNVSNAAAVTLYALATA